MAELQEILAKGQSQISTHLAQLKQVGLVDDRRMGKNSFYRLTASPELMELFRQAAVEIPEAAMDQEALRLTLRKRSESMRRYFEELAGKFGRQYSSRTVVERHRRSAAQIDAADGDRRPWRGRRHHRAVDGAARQESDRGR